MLLTAETDMFSRRLLKSSIAAVPIVLCVFTWASSGRASVSTSENSPYCHHRVRISRGGVAVQFRTNRSSYFPGEAAAFRIDNIGKVSIRLIGEVFSLERFVNGRWRVSPDSPHAFSKIRLGILEPGQSGFCRVFSIPSDIAPGGYRFRKIITISASRKQRSLFAYFHIAEVQAT
jgi:hypothetical protein